MDLILFVIVIVVVVAIIGTRLDPKGPLAKPAAAIMAVGGAVAAWLSQVWPF